MRLLDRVPLGHWTVRPAHVTVLSGRPFTERRQLEGHAVRAMYAASGATDYFLETGDAAYWKTLEGLWRDMTSAKMYLTGGVGSRSSGEAFGEPYELPNRQAYTESCAAIGNLMWNWRMLAATGEARFTDVIERALYNGINSGMSLDGTLYCYRNPLELGLEKIRCPWEGAIEITVTPEQPREFTLFLRVPAWSPRASVAVNGQPWKGPVRAGEYLPVRRPWKAGDRILLTLDVKPRLTVANPRIAENAGRVAVEFGPLVYAAEQADQQGVPSLFDSALTADSRPRTSWKPDLLGGVVVIEHNGLVYEKPLTEEPLYQLLTASPRRTRPVTLRLIPYYAFANRGPTEMQVWLRCARAVR